MTLRTYWRLDPAAEPQRSEPSFRTEQGLTRDVRTPHLNRFDHYQQVARAAAITGFDGLLIAHREDADDSQIIAAAVARAAPRLLLVPEFTASVGSAVYAAKQAVSFQRSTKNRLGWALVPEGDAASRSRGADQIADQDLPARLDEFLKVARGVHGQTGFDFQGRFFEVKGGGFEAPLNQVPFPPVYLRGEEEQALEQSARLADVHLFFAPPQAPTGQGRERLEALRDAIELLDRLALQQDRTVEFGLIASISARETDEEAEAAPAADFVGSYDRVADQLAAVAGAGITHFVLSATPSFEEAYRVGQFVLPRLHARTNRLSAAA